MCRSLIGVLVGASCGSLVGYSIGWWNALTYYRGSEDAAVLILAGVLAGMGALTGAVVGAVGDVLAFLRRLHPGPAADYREPPVPAP